MSLKNHRKILLTGAAGGLGQALRHRLKANCDVLRLSDRASLGEPAADEEIVLADLADAAAVPRQLFGDAASVAALLAPCAPFRAEALELQTPGAAAEPP